MSARNTGRSFFEAKSAFYKKSLGRYTQLPSSTGNAAPVEVLHGVWLGAREGEADAASLRDKGITHILQVACEVQPTHANAAGFTYMNIPVLDIEEQDLVGLFPECFPFMESAIQQGGGVLVHCVAGVSRSASVVLGYVMWKQRLALPAAMAALRALRPAVNPHLGFRLQLQLFEAAGWDWKDWPGWSLDRFMAVKQAMAEAGRLADGGLEGAVEAAAPRLQPADSETSLQPGCTLDDACSSAVAGTPGAARLDAAAGEGGGGAQGTLGSSSQAGSSRGGHGSAGSGDSWQWPRSRVLARPLSIDSSAPTNTTPQLSPDAFGAARGAQVTSADRGLVSPVGQVQSRVSVSGGTRISASGGGRVSASGAAAWSPQGAGPAGPGHTMSPGSSLASPAAAGTPAGPHGQARGGLWNELHYRQSSPPTLDTSGVMQDWVQAEAQRAPHHPAASPVAPTPANSPGAVAAAASAATTPAARALQGAVAAAGTDKPTPSPSSSQLLPNPGSPSKPQRFLSLKNLFSKSQSPATPSNTSSQPAAQPAGNPPREGAGGGSAQGSKAAPEGLSRMVLRNVKTFAGRSGAVAALQQEPEPASPHLPPSPHVPQLAISPACSAPNSSTRLHLNQPAQSDTAMLHGPSRMAGGPRSGGQQQGAQLPGSTGADGEDSAAGAQEVAGASHLIRALSESPQDGEVLGAMRQAFTVQARQFVSMDEQRRPAPGTHALAAHTATPPGGANPPPPSSPAPGTTPGDGQHRPQDPWQDLWAAQRLVNTSCEHVPSPGLGVQAPPNTAAGSDSTRLASPRGSNSRRLAAHAELDRWESEALGLVELPGFPGGAGAAGNAVAITPQQQPHLSCSTEAVSSGSRGSRVVFSPPQAPQPGTPTTHASPPTLHATPTSTPSRPTAPPVLVSASSSASSSARPSISGTSAAAVALMSPEQAGVAWLPISPARPAGLHVVPPPTPAASGPSTEATPRLSLTGGGALTSTPGSAAAAPAAPWLPSGREVRQSSAIEMESSSGLDTPAEPASADAISLAHASRLVQRGGSSTHLVVRGRLSVLPSTTSANGASARGSRPTTGTSTPTGLPSPMLGADGQPLSLTFAVVRTLEQTLGVGLELSPAADALGSRAASFGSSRPARSVSSISRPSSTLTSPATVPEGPSMWADPIHGGAGAAAQQALSRQGSGVSRSPSLSSMSSVHAMPGHMQRSVSNLSSMSLSRHSAPHIATGATPAAGPVSGGSLHSGTMSALHQASQSAGGALGLASRESSFSSSPTGIVVQQPTSQLPTSGGGATSGASLPLGQPANAAAAAAAAQLRPGAFGGTRSSGRARAASTSGVSLLPAIPPSPRDSWQGLEEDGESPASGSSQAVTPLRLSAPGSQLPPAAVHAPAELPSSGSQQAADAGVTGPASWDAARAAAAGGWHAHLPTAAGLPSGSGHPPGSGASQGGAPVSASHRTSWSGRPPPGPRTSLGRVPMASPTGPVPPAHLHLMNASTAFTGALQHALAAAELVPPANPEATSDAPAGAGHVQVKRSLQLAHDVSSAAGSPGPRISSSGLQLPSVPAPALLIPLLSVEAGGSTDLSALQLQ